MLKRIILEDSKHIEDLDHGIRVANLCFRLSETLGLSNKIIKEIYISALFHDVGKLYLDKSILYKPSKLNKNEKIYIQEHSKFSYKEVLNLGYSMNIALNTLYHHENYNGTGYPSKLKEEDIPIGARIIKICDTFDALISNRSYKKPLNVNNAINIMDDDISIFDFKIYEEFRELIMG